MAAQFCEYNENHWIINFKWLKVIVYELYVNAGIFKISMRPDGKYTKIGKVDHFILFQHIYLETLGHFYLLFSDIC